MKTQGQWEFFSLVNNSSTSDFQVNYGEVDADSRRLMPPYTLKALLHNWQCYTS